MYKASPCQQQKGRLPTNELRIYAEAADINIACIQEPYCYRGSEGATVPGFGHMYSVTGDAKADSFNAAITCFNTNINIVKFPNFTSSNMETVQVTYGDLALVLCSVYCPSNDDINDSLDVLESTFRSFPGGQLIIAGDSMPARGFGTTPLTTTEA